VDISLIYLLSLTSFIAILTHVAFRIYTSCIISNLVRTLVGQIG
jgi:hypothetical protein